MNKQYLRPKNSTRPLDELIANGAAALVVLLLLACYATLFKFTVWGHDEVHYYPVFDFKLTEDGRWLNHLLHDVLRSLPPLSWALGWLAGWAFLIHRIGRDLGWQRPDAIALAGTVVLALPFAEQVLWPATAMPALVALLMLQVALRRGLSVPAFYLIGGTVIFGSIQSFYFVMPLLALGAFFDPSHSTRQRWLTLVAHMGWWVIGAVVGVVAMSLAVWGLAGQFGVEPAAWRQTQPIEHAEDVLRNLRHVGTAFATQGSELAANFGLTHAWVLGSLTLVALIRWHRFPTALPATLALLAVALGFFAMSVPLAPVIQSRSLVALATSLVVALALLPGRGTKGRVATLVLLGLMAWNASIVSGRSLDRHLAETGWILDRVTAVLPAPQQSYTAIALYGAIPEGEPLSWLFNDAARMRGVVHAAGVSDYRDCRTGFDPRCGSGELPPALHSVPFGSGELWFAPRPDRVAIIGWRARNESAAGIAPVPN